MEDLSAHLPTRQERPAFFQMERVAGLHDPGVYRRDGSKREETVSSLNVVNWMNIQTNQAQ